MTSVTCLSTSEADTMALARRLAARLCPGTVVALSGELGAGKTCFVRGLAEGLGLPARSVSSPTFVIVHEYGSRLIHIDAYRLSGPDDLESIGWEEMLDRARAVIALEWPTRISEALPAARVEVRIAHGEHDVRKITIEAVGGCNLDLQGLCSGADVLG